MKIILFKSTDFSVQMRQLNFNLIKWSIPVNISWILENHSQVPSSLIIQSEILREGLRTEQFKSTLNKISKKGPTNSGGTSMLNLYLRAGYDKIGLDLTTIPLIKIWGKYVERVLELWSNIQTNKQTDIIYRLKLDVMFA